MIIIGDITPAEWARFCSYAVRVREISYSPPGVDPLIWTILARKCQGEPLFPRLRLIVAWGVTKHDVPALVSLLSPSLRNFYLQAAGPLNPQSALQLCAGLMVLFQTLVDIAPDLTELDWLVPCNWRFGTRFLVRIGHLQSLRTIRLLRSPSVTPTEICLQSSTQVPAAETPLLQALAAIPPLRYLSLDVGLADLHRKIKTISGLTFEALHTLHVTGGPAPMLATFVHSLRLPALQSLAVDTSLSVSLTFSTLTSSTLEDQLRRICANLPRSLQEFCWQHEGESTPSSGISSDILCILEPLLSFGRLHCVNFELASCTFPLHITDDDVARLSAAWPNIQTLCIETSPETQIVSTNDIHPTIATQATFAQHCPKLSELALPSLDLSSIHLLTDVPLLPQHPLEHLSVSAAICGDASLVQIAAALDRLFPKLDVDRLFVTPAQLSDTNNSATSSLPSGWKTIQEIVEALQRARRCERMRVKLLETDTE